MPKHSRTPFALLGLSSRVSISGHTASASFAKATSLFWRESRNQLYPAFKALIQEGLVERDASAKAVDHREKCYRITDAGKEALARWLRAPPKKSIRNRDGDGVVLRVSFGEHVCTSVTRALLESERERIVDNLEELEREDIEELETFERMGASWCVHYAEARLDWIDRCLEQLT